MKIFTINCLSDHFLSLFSALRLMSMLLLWLCHSFEWYLVWMLTLPSSLMVIFLQVCYCVCIDALNSFNLFSVNRGKIANLSNNWLLQGTIHNFTPSELKMQSIFVFSIIFFTAKWLVNRYLILRHDDFFLNTEYDMKKQQQ